jgi:hypothetical protein
MHQEAPVLVESVQEVPMHQAQEASMPQAQEAPVMQGWDGSDTALL